MFETDIPLPEHVQVAALVTDPKGGPALRRIYESYVDAARPFGRLELVHDAQSTDAPEAAAQGPREAPY